MSGPTVHWIGNTELCKVIQPDCNGSTMCTFLRVVKAGVVEVEVEVEEEGEEEEAVPRMWSN